MAPISIIAVGVILLAGVLAAERSLNRKVLVPTKGILSCLFVLTALIQPSGHAAYGRWILAGLLCCLIGDVCLALPRKGSFLLGLAAFLTGHIFYVIGFFRIREMGWWTWIGLVLACSGSLWIYRWLRPHLGPMKKPVVAYIIVITLMVVSASSTLNNLHLSAQLRVMIATGAVLFYVSDIFVARDRFVKTRFLNRAIGLPLYYTGQFLLAFSTGLL